MLGFFDDKASKPAAGGIKPTMLAHRDDVRTLARTRDPEFEQMIANIKLINDYIERSALAEAA